MGPMGSIPGQEDNSGDGSGKAQAAGRAHIANPAAAEPAERLSRRSEYGEVKRQEGWKSCLIVGSGPSLRNFNYDRLRGQKVIAVNSAISKVHWADCFFGADWKWFATNGLMLQGFQGERYAAIPERFHAITCNLGLTYLRRSWDEGISEHPGEIKLRANSGYGAIQAAILKGAREITLLGFDLLPGREDPMDARPEEISKYHQWRVEFDKLFTACRNAGILIAYGHV